MNKNKSTTIIALTTDPYNNIYGYSLVFLRLFDFMQKNYPNLQIHLITNNGLSSSLVSNKTFQSIKLNPNTNILVKTIALTYYFVRLAWLYPPNTIIITNAELPEIFAGLLLKFKFKKVYSVFQDDRVRNKSWSTKFICKLRVFLLYKIKNIIFTNHYTMNRFNNSINKVYIGNPIF